MKYVSLVLVVLICFVSTIHAQTKKSMTPDVYSEWNRIRNVKITNDGNWVMYRLTREVGNKTLKIYNTQLDQTYSFDRVKKASFDNNGDFAYFIIEHDYDDLRNLKRKKTKKDELPHDTLVVYSLDDKVLTKIPNVKSYATPEDWSDYVAIQLEPDAVQDTVNTPIKESKDNGSKLILMNTVSKSSDTLYYATDYAFAKSEMGFVATSKGAETALNQGVYNYNFERSTFEPILASKGKVSKLSWHDDAEYLAFVMDNDTTKNRVTPYELYLWDIRDSIAKPIANQGSDFLPENYNISNFSKPKFSQDGSRLIFGITPPPILQDTSLLEDEIVQVEIWNYNDHRLYTHLENNVESDKKIDYRCIYNIDNSSFRVIGDERFEGISFDEDYESKYGIALHTKSYEKPRMWTAYGHFDGFRIDLNTGEHKQFTSKSRGRMMRSPGGNFCMWYDAGEGAHYAYDVVQNKVNQITSKSVGTFGDELNDRPMDPSSYGYHGFSEKDAYVILYDRYDIWVVDPTNKETPRKITNGRSSKKIHRIIDLDPDDSTTDLQRPLLIHIFDENDKSEAYATIDPVTGIITELYKGNFRLDRSPIKAKNANVVVTTVEDYKTFPDLVLTNTSFEDMHTFTNANPQQKEYLWGDIHLHSWETEAGEILKGLVVLPEDFDPKKKYPLLVNFYERSSNRLNRHRAPYAHRSTINYSYYSSKGYIIFNPDVVYRIGYPGQSCYESVIPGIKSLIEEGYIDEDRIGVQGHSWGGYQIADLLTKTDIFKCAEAGAPVVNMVSAYGGIRWGSGMSRMFQYEKTQSRLGATLWERPDLYLENSPIFKIDKVNTPVLILHNDEDGAVPWYQGIEYFNALKRLNKPAWFLNYNNEPHWPVKWQNRLDFNKRMEQFFDHYLMDAPMPRWMKEGVPPIKKGIDQGLETNY